MYEGKMIWLYNHHFASWPTSGERPSSIPNVGDQELKDPKNTIMPWYWASENNVLDKLRKEDNDGNVLWEWNHPWLLGYRKISNATNERTFIADIFPLPQGSGDSIIYIMIDNALDTTLCQCMFSSITFDYISRQKMGGSNMSNFICKQLPVIERASFTQSKISDIISRAFELNFFNYDLQGWADEIWEEADDELKDAIINRFEECNETTVSDKAAWKPKPCIFNPERRAIAQAELDAIYAHLYKLNTEDLKYILDPEDVCGEGCINETFRVLKDREIRELGEYRTKRLVIEAWHRFGFDNNN